MERDGALLDGIRAAGRARECRLVLRGPASRVRVDPWLAIVLSGAHRMPRWRNPGDGPAGRILWRLDHAGRRWSLQGCSRVERMVAAHRRAPTPRSGEIDVRSTH